MHIHNIKSPLLLVLFKSFQIHYTNILLFQFQKDMDKIELNSNKATFTSNYVDGLIRNNEVFPLLKSNGKFR